MAIFCEQLLCNATPKIFGNGKETRDCAYVTAPQTNVKALERGHGEIFNIASGQPITAKLATVI